MQCRNGWIGKPVSFLLVTRKLSVQTTTGDPAVGSPQVGTQGICRHTCDTPTLRKSIAKSGPTADLQSVGTIVRLQNSRQGILDTVVAQMSWLDQGCNRTRISPILLGAHQPASGVRNGERQE
jgi:hypothetical protein